METAIGVFASRDNAEEAVKELRERSVPEDSIVFLTRSENEAKTVAKEVGAFVGGFVGGAAGMTTGVVAATLASWRLPLGGGAPLPSVQGIRARAGADPLGTFC